MNNPRLTNGHLRRLGKALNIFQFLFSKFVGIYWFYKVSEIVSVSLLTDITAREIEITAAAAAATTTTNCFFVFGSDLIHLMEPKEKNVC